MFGCWIPLKKELTPLPPKKNFMKFGIGLEQATRSLASRSKTFSLKRSCFRPGLQKISLTAICMVRLPPLLVTMPNVETLFTVVPGPLQVGEFVKL